MFCEFCHKIGEATLVLSMRLHRPKEGQQLFFGNFDDVTRRVSYLPLGEESAFCAPCHFGVFWDTVIAAPRSQPHLQPSDARRDDEEPLQNAGTMTATARLGGMWLSCRPRQCCRVIL